MKDGFRQCMAWLHTWSGLIAGWILFFVFVTGATGYFSKEITRWMQPELPVRAAQELPAMPAMLDLALGRLEQTATNAAYWHIVLPHESLGSRNWQNLSIAWESLEPDGREGVYTSLELDADSGRVLRTPPARQTGGGDALYEMHYALHYIPYDSAILIVGACTMLMLLAIVSGVITHKRIFADFFTFRSAKGHRSWLDAHNLAGVLTLPFLLMITYSGLLFFGTTYMPAALAAIYGDDGLGRERYEGELHFEDHRPHLAVARPAASLADMVSKAESAWGASQVAFIAIEHHEGHDPIVSLQKINGGQLLFYDPPTMSFHADTGVRLAQPSSSSLAIKTNEALLALHEGRFATGWLRWLYFISGLIGCAVVATGLVLWTAKRRRHHQELKGDARVGLRLVEALNVGTIAGLPTAVAAFFWGNRLLPVDLDRRAEWEVHIMFMVWAELFLYAVLRPRRHAWVELLWLAAAAYGLLPLLNFLTTERHLGVTLPAQDWVLAGFDITALGLAALFAYAALKVRHKWATSAQQIASTCRADDPTELVR